MLSFLFKKRTHVNIGPTEEGWLPIVFFIFKFVESMRLQNWWFDRFIKGNMELLQCLQYQNSSLSSFWSSLYWVLFRPGLFWWIFVTSIIQNSIMHYTYPTFDRYSHCRYGRSILVSPFYTVEPWTFLMNWVIAKRYQQQSWSQSWFCFLDWFSARTSAKLLKMFPCFAVNFSRMLERHVASRFPSKYWQDSYFFFY